MGLDDLPGLADEGEVDQALVLLEGGEEVVLVVWVRDPGEVHLSRLTVPH